MSDTVHYKGKLTPTGKTLEQYAGKDADIYDDALYNKVVEIDGLIWEVSKEDIDPCADIFRATENEDGSISFEVRYYNGGCCFTEAIDTAIEAASV